MTINQLQGWVKNLAAVFLGSLTTALLSAWYAGDLQGWDMLLGAIKAHSFAAFMAALTIVGGWLGMASPVKPQE